VTSVVK